MMDDPEATAKAAGLRYTPDEGPGIRRRRTKNGFTYKDRNGRAVGSKVKARLDALAIPPAWEDVWINPDPRGHVQATGRDDAGRKQYIYHPDWRAVRDEAKFNGLVRFGEALPELRRRLDADLRKHGLPREKAVAAVVRLLDDTVIRIGNLSYARENDSYGLTTLREDHVDVKGSRIRFHFPGKGGKKHEVEFTDRRLARVIQRMSDLDGDEIVSYEDDDGKAHPIRSDDVNRYVHDVMGEGFTSKDFRTWSGSVEAARVLHERGKPESDGAAEGDVREAVKVVAEHLGNTAAVARGSYIHPRVLEAHEGRFLHKHFEKAKDVRKEVGDELDEAEAAVLSLLRALS